MSVQKLSKKYNFLFLMVDMALRQTKSLGVPKQMDLNLGKKLRI